MTREEGRAFRLEISKAGKPGRLGITTIDVMEWIIRFAQMDLSALSVGGWQDLAYEMQCFNEFGGNHAITEYPKNDLSLLNSAVSFHNWQGKRHSSKNPLHEDCSIFYLRHLPNVLRDAFSLQPSLPSHDQIISLQGKIKDILIKIIKKHVTVLPCPRVYRYIGPVSSSGLMEPISIAETPEDLFLHNFLKILDHYLQRLSECPECEMMFLLERSNKTFCSPKCQNRVAVRRFRGISSERKGKVGRPKTGIGKKAKNDSRVSSPQKRTTTKRRPS